MKFAIVLSLAVAMGLVILVEAASLEQESTAARVRGDFIPFYVKHITKKHLHFRLYHEDLDMTVHALKLEIQKFDKFPAQNQSLFYKGTKMEDEKILEYYDVLPFELITCVLTTDDDQ